MDSKNVAVALLIGSVTAFVSLTVTSSYNAWTSAAPAVPAIRPVTYVQKIVPNREVIQYSTTDRTVGSVDHMLPTVQYQSSSTLPTVGTLSLIACGAAVLSFVLKAAHKKPAQLLEPLSMLSTAASADSVTPSDALKLWAQQGYIILDIRSEMEGSEGRLRSNNKGTIDVPLIFAKSQYDSASGKRVIKQEFNAKFLDQVAAKIPKDAKVIVMCSDGATRTSQALNLLRGAGYRNVAGLSGGYNKWNQLFDRLQQPRDAAAQSSRAATLKDPIAWISAGGMSAAPQTRAPAYAAPAYAAPAAPAYTPPSPRKPSGHSAAEVSSVRASSPSMYLDPAFQAATLAAFPAKVNATVEEARVLWKLGGYSLLDVRSDMEGAAGRIRGPNKGSIDIPMFNAKSVYDSNLGTKVVTQEVNSKWLEQVKARFPDKNSKIVIVCSDGTTRSSQAIDLLAAQGYTNLVLMRGGFNRWDQIFDRSLALRSPAQQAAKAEWLDDPIQWGRWAAGAGVQAPPSRAVAPAAAPATRTVRETVSQGAFSDSGFQAATVAAFPSKSAATVEEARVLWKGDYSILDLRSEMEGNEGRIRGPNKGTIDIPLINARGTYDSTLGKKVVTQERNKAFMDQVKARFPKDSKIILMCGDGTTRSAQAAELLRAEGYKNVVVMAGGFRKWDQLFDNRLGVRTLAAQQSKQESLKDPVHWMRW